MIKDKTTIIRTIINTILTTLIFLFFLKEESLELADVLSVILISISFSLINNKKYGTFSIIFLALVFYLRPEVISKDELLFILVLASSAESIMRDSSTSIIVGLLARYNIFLFVFALIVMIIYGKDKKVETMFRIIASFFIAYLAYSYDNGLALSQLQTLTVSIINYKDQLLLFLLLIPLAAMAYVREVELTDAITMTLALIFTMLTNSMLLMYVAIYFKCGHPYVIKAIQKVFKDTKNKIEKEWNLNYKRNKSYYSVE